MADSNLQVGGCLGGGAGGTHAEPKKKEGLAFKPFFLALWASVRPKNKEGAWTPPLVPPHDTLQLSGAGSPSSRPASVQ